MASFLLTQGTEITGQSRVSNCSFVLEPWRLGSSPQLWGMGFLPSAELQHCRNRWCDCRGLDPKTWSCCPSAKDPHAPGMLLRLCPCFHLRLYRVWKLETQDDLILPVLPLSPSSSRCLGALCMHPRGPVAMAVGTRLGKAGHLLPFHQGSCPGLWQRVMLR